MAASGSQPAHDHERSDVAPRWPIYIGVGMLLTLPVAIALISLLLNSVWAPAPGSNRAPLAMPAPAPDAPRLQLDPRADLARLQQRWQRRLHGIGWVDRDAGIVHVPIEQAKRRLIENGLPEDTRVPAPSRGDGREAPPAAADNRAAAARSIPGAPDASPPLSAVARETPR